MAQVLLYNITDREKLLKIRLLLLRLRVACREVAPEEHAHPLGYLLGLPGYAPSPDEAVPFTEELLVMDGLSADRFNALLDGLRSEGAPIALKAVATEHNVAWSSARLCRELQSERLAMSRAAARHPAKTSAHSKKK
ncbi:MAG: DUF3783 domain-containing protein [Oscillospiraceae bacterium]|nr:DUF3783 domain-containing protein [Oscillospiraceae bacterium]